MNTYKVTTKYQVLEVEAASFQQDGSGTRFYDDNNELIAAFYDGVVYSVFKVTTVAAEQTTQEELQ